MSEEERLRVAIRSYFTNGYSSQQQRERALWAALNIGPMPVPPPSKLAPLGQPPSAKSGGGGMRDPDAAE